MEGCYSSAMEVLKKTRAKLNNVAKALIKEETLDRDEFEKIVGLKKVLAKVRAE